MVTNYIGADVDCKMTELAVERKGKIVARERKAQWQAGCIVIFAPK